MPAAAVRKTAGMLKQFRVDDKSYTFYFIPDPDDRVNASIFTFEDEELVRKRFWYPNIKRGDIVFDIGASFGSYTLTALALGATVYAFSPEHEFPKIAKSVEENRGFTQRCHIYNFGFYSDTGLFKTDTAKFYKKSEIDRDEVERLEQTMLCGWYIPVMTLDDFVPSLKLEKIDFIKIDTEGAEFEILKGGIKTLKKYKPKLAVEYHLFKDHELENKCSEFLQSLGYECECTAKSPNNVGHGFWVPVPAPGSA